MKNTNTNQIIRRLKIVEGQLRGLQTMVGQGKYCIDIITQTSAVKQALSNIEDMLMENHLGACVIHQIEAGQTTRAKSEILKVYKLKRK